MNREEDPKSGEGGSVPAVKPDVDAGGTVRRAIKPLDITVPSEIGRYTVGRRIGSGTCGVVHHGLDNVLGREVAVKLSPIGETHVSTGKVPGAQRAYQTEIVAAGRLAHPNIVTVHDAGQYEELNYLVMEVVNGRSLKEYGKGKTQLPVHKAISVICDCCRALDYSHRQGILHRDIKPANIMLADDGVVKLLDFGIAVGLTGTAGLSKQGPTLGTPNYMSPEQILGRELAPTSDFYSLATVLFELLTGRQLFKAKKVKELFRTVVQKTAPSLGSVRKDMPKGLSLVVSKALQKKPASRYQSGAEMAEALEPFADLYRVIESHPPEFQRYVAELQRGAFLKAFSFVEISALVDQVTVRTFARGERLLDGSSDRRHLLIVTEGLIRVEQDGRFHCLITRGDCVGEASFISGHQDERKVVCATEVEVLEVSTLSLSKLPPKMHLHYFRIISDRLDAQKADREGPPAIDHTL